MNQAELITYIADLTDVSKTDVAKVLEALGDAILAEVNAGGEVSHRSIGKWSLGIREGHPGRDPRTGETIQIQTKRIVRFKPSKVLKDALNPVPLVPRRVA